MVALVLRLRLAALFGALRGDRAHRVRMLIGLAVVVVAVAATCIAALSLRNISSEAAGVVIVLGGAALTLGFALVPLVSGAVDPLAPRRFVVLDIPPGRLAAALAMAGLVGVPGLVMIVLGTCVAAVWIAQGASPVVAVLSAVIGVVTCVMLARVGEATAAMVMRERRSRELTGVFIVGALVVIVPAVVFLASLEWSGAVPVQLRDAIGVLALTPVGAAWALPATEGGSFAGALLIAVATLALLGVAWTAIVRRALTSTERPIAVRERGGLGWFAVAPGTPAGAIAARSLVYWLRDRRHLMNIVVVPVTAALTVVPLLVVGVPLEIVALVPVPVAALLFGWLPHNDLAYDSTAVWMHIASGVRGAADRIGRLVPMLLIGVPVLAVALPVAIAVQGRWALLPALAGVSTALFLSALGLSSIFSALMPYPVSRPGDSPFQQPQRTGAGGFFSPALVLGGALVLSVPALWAGWLTLTVDISYAWLALWVGVLGGIAVLVIGVAVGGLVFRRGGSRLMEFAEAS